MDIVEGHPESILDDGKVARGGFFGKPMDTELETSTLVIVGWLLSKITCSYFRARKGGQKKERVQNSTREAHGNLFLDSSLSSDRSDYEIKLMIFE